MLGGLAALDAWPLSFAWLASAVRSMPTTFPFHFEGTFFQLLPASPLKNRPPRPSSERIRLPSETEAATGKLLGRLATEARLAESVSTIGALAVTSILCV